MRKIIATLLLSAFVVSCNSPMTWRTYKRRCIKIVSDYNPTSRAREMCSCEVDKLKEAGYTPRKALELNTENIKKIEGLIKDC